MSWAGDRFMIDPLISPPCHRDSEQAQLSDTALGLQKIQCQAEASEATICNSRRMRTQERYVKLYESGKIETSPALTQFQPLYKKILLNLFLKNLPPKKEQAAKKAKRHNRTFCDELVGGVEGESEEKKHSPIKTSTISTSSAPRGRPPKSTLKIPGQIKQKIGNLVSDVKGTNHDGELIFQTSDEKGIMEYWYRGLDYFGGVVRHIIAEKWITDLEPRRQSNFAYIHKVSPNWWPGHSRYTGPQHMSREELIEWYLAMFMGKREGRFPEDSHEGSAQWFAEGVKKCRCKLEEKMPATRSLETVQAVMRNMLKLLGAMQRFDRGELDGTAIVTVRPIPAKPPKARKKEEGEVEEDNEEEEERKPKIKRQKDMFEDDESTNNCSTPSTPNECTEEQDQTIKSEDTSSEFPEPCSPGMISSVDHVRDIIAERLPSWPQPETSNPMYPLHTVSSSSQLCLEGLAAGQPLCSSREHVHDLDQQLPCRPHLTAEDNLDGHPFYPENLNIQILHDNSMSRWENDSGNLLDNPMPWSRHVSHQDVMLQTEYSGSFSQRASLPESVGQDFEQLDAVSPQHYHNGQQYIPRYIWPYDAGQVPIQRRTQ